MQPTSKSDARLSHVLPEEGAARTPVLDDSDLGQGLGGPDHPDSILVNSAEDNDDVSRAHTPRRPGSDTLAGGTDEDVFTEVHQRSIDDAKQTVEEGGIPDSTIPENRPIDEAATAQRRTARNETADESSGSPADDDSATEQATPRQKPTFAG